jgi:flagella basal body P-ring formation protein flgA
LHVRREKLHRAAVLGLLLLTLLAGSDSEAAPREQDASRIQIVHSLPGNAPTSDPHAEQPAVTDTTVSPGTANADTMLAWLKRQPGFPSGQGVQTRLDILRQPRTAHLAPCQRTEYVLAAGARLWGRVNLGERCTSGATWTVWHNLQIHVEGPALVARQQLAAGSVPQPADFSVQRVDWTRSPTPPLPIDTRLGGQELQRALAAGQSLHADHLRPAPSIRSGEVVAAIAEGDGFRIATDAIALASAGEGQSIRVRTPGGKVLSGLVEGKTVKIFR